MYAGFCREHFLGEYLQGWGPKTEATAEHAGFSQKPPVSEQLSGASVSLRFTFIPKEWT